MTPQESAQLKQDFQKFKSIKQDFASFRASQTNTDLAVPEEKKPSLMSRVGSSWMNSPLVQGNIGIAKGLGETATGFVSGVTEVANPVNIYRGIKQAIRGKAGADTASIPGVGSGILKSGVFEAKNTPQKVGKFFEFGAEALTSTGISKGISKGVTSGILNKLPTQVVAGSGKLPRFARATADVIGRSTAEGSIVGAQSAIKTGGNPEETAHATAIGLAFPVVGSVLKLAAEPLKPLVRSLGERILTATIKPTGSDIEKGFNVQNISKYGLRGNMRQMLSETSKKISGFYEQLKTKLVSAPPEAKVDLIKVLENTEKEINENLGKKFGNAQATKRAIEELWSEASLVSPKDSVVDLLKATDIKHGAGLKGAWIHAFPDPDSNAKESAYNIFYKNIRKEIEDVGTSVGIPEINFLNKQMGELIPIQSALIRRLPVAERREILGVLRSMELIGAIFNPKAISFAIVRELLSSNRVGGALSGVGVKTLENGKNLIPTDIKNRIFGAPPRQKVNISGMGAAGATEKFPHIDAKLAETIRNTKGLTAEQITIKHPDIQLKRDVPATDVYGKKVVIPDGEVLTPYEMKGNKVLLQDGETYIVSKNQYANIKGNANVSGSVKEFAPELKGTTETVKGDKPGTVGLSNPNYTKYDQYQLPDGKNYKEILIKASPTERTDVSFEDFVKQYNKRFPDTGRTPEQIRPMYTQGNVIPETGRMTSIKTDVGFRSSHWDEPNVISHLRMNERTYNGKKVAFMEELQSDWMRALRDEAKQKTMVNGVPDKAKANDYVAKAFAGTIKTDTPVNQMLKSWETPAIKRALKDAVDTNAEYFAWINGEQTSARYDLATKLDNVKWFDPSTNKVGRKSIVLEPKSGGKRLEFELDKSGVINQIEDGVPSDWKGKNLDEVLGKGLADSIMAKESGTLSGEGLKFGGEWSNNLYDKQVGNIVKDLTGGKVEVLDMGLPIDGKAKVNWGFKDDLLYNKKLTQKDLKVSREVFQSENSDFLQRHNLDNRGSYIITDVLGGGKFEAVPREIYDNATNKGVWTRVSKNDTLKDFIKRNTEVFDISVKKSAGQQGIRLTPEIKAKIKGEAIPVERKTNKLPMSVSKTPKALSSLPFLAPRKSTYRQTPLQV
jgi:hypothetical protein